MKAFLSITLAFLLISCGNNELIKSTASLNIEGNVYKIKGRLYTGQVLDTTKQGRVLTSFRCVNGKIEGEYIQYNENGKISVKKNYKKGVPDGVCKSFSYDGNLVEEKRLKNGKLDGKFFHIQEGGRYEINGFFKNGLQYGLWTYRNKYTHKLVVKGAFDGGDGLNRGNSGIPRNGRVGKWEFYDENAQLEEVQIYNKNSDEVTYFGYYPTGQVKYKGVAKRNPVEVIFFEEYDIHGNIIKSE